MTCGVFIVHAANSNSWLFTQRYSIDNADNTLTDGEWNQLMNDLDNLIPEWTVMAFLTDECPVGWDPLPQSDWRFLMWTLGQDFWYTGWATNNQISLSTNQLPSHTHLIKFTAEGKFWDASDDRMVPVDYYTNHWPKWWDNNAHWTNDHKTHQSSPSPDKYIQTSKTWSWNSINIAPSYIKVRYCIKWNYSLAEDSCPNGYSSNITPATCGAWYTCDYVDSTYGTMQCGKRTPKSCPPSYPFQCGLDRDKLYYVVAIWGYAWENTCIKSSSCCVRNIQEAIYNFWAAIDDNYLSNECR